MKMNFNFVNPEAPDPAPGGGAQGHEPKPRMAEPRRLSDLTRGETAVVASIDDDGAVGRRLLDLGLLPGTRVRMLRRAPLGDPTVYELRGYRLCLRRHEGERVGVTALAQTSPRLPQPSPHLLEPSPEESPPRSGKTSSTP